MQKFTKIEIGWMADVMEKAAREYYDNADDAAASDCCSRLYQLRAEQFDGIAAKLRTAVKSGDKRIAIDY